MSNALDRLLTTLEVRLESFALIDVRRDHLLTFDALDQVIIHFVLSGEGWLDAPGRTPTRCAAGSIVVLPAAMKQSLRIDDAPAIEVKAAEHCLMVRDGLVRFDATGGGAPELQLLCGSVMPTAAGSYGLFDGLRAPLVERFEDVPNVAAAFELLRAEVAAPGLGTRAMAGALMKLCLVLLVRRHFCRLAAESPLLASLGDTRLSGAVAAVLDAPAEPHTVASLAAAAAMSRSAFARTFQDAFAIAPMEFVARTRLHHAAELLRTTDLPVKVVAASIGFASRSHFTRAFRRAYGSDPRRFRQGDVTRIDPPGTLRGSRATFGLSEEPDP